MKKVLSNIREFFWPLLEKEDKGVGRNVPNTSTNFQISKSNLEEAYRLKSKIFENEEERRKGIESKSSLFISTISVATSIVVAANALITGNQEINLPVKISVIISFILSIYAVRTVWFSLKALERRSYSVLDFEDINVPGTKSQYYKHLILSIQKKVKRNQASINEKVDYFTLAQEYYKRAICILCIYSLLILIFCLFFKKATNNDRQLQINKIEISKQSDCDTLSIPKKKIFNSIQLDSIQDIDMIESNKVKI